MYNLIVVSHGNLAEQLINSSEMLLGKKEGVSSVCLKWGETKEDFENRIEEALNKFDGDILMLADLFGGTPFNCAISCILKRDHRIQLLAGVNLPMVLHALMHMDGEIASVVDEIEKAALDGIQNANKILRYTCEE